MQSASCNQFWTILIPYSFKSRYKIFIAFISIIVVSDDYDNANKYITAVLDSETVDEADAVLKEEAQELLKKIQVLLVINK